MLNICKWLAAWSTVDIIADSKKFDTKCAPLGSKIKVFTSTIEQFLIILQPLGLIKMKKVELNLFSFLKYKHLNSETQAHTFGLNMAISGIPCLLSLLEEVKNVFHFTPFELALSHSNDLCPYYWLHWHFMQICVKILIFWVFFHQ